MTDFGAVFGDMRAARVALHEASERRGAGEAPPGRGEAVDAYARA
jgi:hypothetical protein